MTTTDLVPSHEQDRLDAVRRYDILDAPPDGAFDRIAALAARLLGVPIAIVSIVDTDRIWFASHHGLDVRQVGRDPGLCASCILGSEPWIVTDASVDPRALANPLVAGELGLRFYAGAPLTTHDGYNLGTLCVIDQQPREITPDETRLLTELADMVMDELELRRSALSAVQEAEQRLGEVERLAKALQSSLLPPSLPEIPFLEVGARFQPASHFEVGGDFYDVFPIHENAWGFVIGDVCGKGPDAAARTSAARYGIRGAAIRDRHPSRVLKSVNRVLLSEPDSSGDSNFVTALFARAERDGDTVRVRFASAGHPLPTLLRADGSVEIVGTPGTLLGVFPEIVAVDCAVDLAPGDTVVLITDGVHDSGHPTRLMQEGLEEILSTCKGMGADEIAGRLHRAVASAQRDDLAILVLAAI